MHTGKSFEGALSTWIKLRQLNTKPNTQKFYGFVRAVMLRHWPDPAQLVESVTLDEALDFAQRVAHYSPSYWNGIVAALHFLVPEARVIKFRAMRMKDRPLLSQAEFTRLLAECDKLPRSRAGLVVNFLAHTGLRINEARQLRWSDVGADCVTVPGSLTKNGKPRVIPFINGIREVLARLRAVTGERPFVLPGASVRKGLHRACRRAGVPALGHHDFRHLFATRCITSGVDLPTVARWLGHRDGGALLARTYFHLVDEHSRTMAAKVVVV